MLSALLILNVGIIIFTQNRRLEYILPSDVISKFFDIYRVNKVQIENDYITRQNGISKINEMIHEATLKGIKNIDIEMPESKYINSDIWSDDDLYNELYGRIKTIIEYPYTVQQIIDKAYNNLDAFGKTGISSDTYAYKYQLKVIEFYKTAQSEVQMKLEYTRGWDEYFNYNIVNVFIFIMLITTGSVVFAYEKNTGILEIIRTYKNGRVKTATAKIATMMIVTTVIVLLFTFSTWTAYGMILGYSSTSNAIQVLSEFLLSPYLITVGQYFLLTIVIKITVFLVFAAVILAISVFFYNYAVIYICGLGFFGVNFLLYSIKYLNADNPFRNLNLMAAAAVNPLFVRYRSINIFGYVIGSVSFMCVMFAMIFTAAVAVIIWKYNKSTVTVNITFIKNMNVWANRINKKIVEKFEKSKRRISHSYSMSVISAECYKTLIASRFFIIIVILLIVKCYTVYMDFTSSDSYSDAVYKEYMTTLRGPLTDEKRTYIEKERAGINEALDNQTVMRQAYNNGEITDDEYSKYLNDYNYAYMRNGYLSVIESHQSYIVNTYNEKNVDAWFVYDTGWKILFSSGFDITLYTALLLLFTGVFSSEYNTRSSSGAFAQIMRTTKNGRNKTFYTKYISSGIIAILLSFIWNSIDFLYIIYNYDLPSMNAPLLSIQTFTDIDSDITIIQYLILFWSLRIIGSLLFTWIICGVSELLRKNLSVMGTIVAFTLLPALFVCLGLEIFKYVDFTRLFSATKLVLLSASGNTDYGFLVVYITVTTAITILLGLRAKKTWT